MGRRHDSPYTCLQFTLSKLADLVPNYACVLCHQHSRTSICTYCQADVKDLFSQWGRINLLHVPEIASGLLPPVYDTLYAAGRYEWPYDIMVHKLKHQRQSLGANWLVNAFSENILAHCPTLPDALVPVPLSAIRLWHRQFNQAALLAHQLSTVVGCPVVHGVKRVRHTQRQQFLRRTKRLENLQHAFQACESLHHYNHIAIVDDVVTTGATVNAVASAIKRQCPDIQISVWAMAITAQVLR